MKFEIGTHHLVSPNKIKKYSQQFDLESSLARYLCELDMWLGKVAVNQCWLG